MGAGKTEAFVDALRKLPKGATVLVITHSLVLSRKVHKEIEGLGFHLYLEKTAKPMPRALDDPPDPDDGSEAPTPCMMTQSRIVCCLDSLHRVDALYFDHVVCDEVLSILQRFYVPAPMMERRIGVCEIFR